MTSLSATEVARTFSDVLNRVASGEEIEITRGGAAVALIGPPKQRLLSPERFGDLLSSAPPVDERFGEELREIRASVAAPVSSWPS